MTAPLNLGKANWLQDTDLQRVLEIVSTQLHPARVNGGAVRNAVLGAPISDVDISSVLLPEQVIERVERSGLKAIPTGIDHGTVTVVANKKSFEVTTLREDIETDGRHAVVRFGSDWSRDAMRRDLTMNALYCDREGAILDPLGGYDDLINRRVKFIGKAEDRIKEDHLRILRFFRFFAWYGSFRPDAEGLKASAKLKEQIRHLSVERVWVELTKLLSAEDPRKALLWMRTSGVLGQTLPEGEKWGIDLIHPFIDCEQEQEWPRDPIARLQAILPKSPEIIAGLCKRLKLSNQETARLQRWAMAELPPLERSKIEPLLYWNGTVGIADTLRLEVARLKQVDGDVEERQTRIYQLDFIRQWQRPTFPVSGKDLIANGHEVGEQMGKTLNRLEKLWVESGFTLTKQTLVDRV